MSHTFTNPTQDVIDNQRYTYGVVVCLTNTFDRYFAGRLKPVPITLVATSPHGHWWGLTSGMRPGNGEAVCRCHLLQLTYPGQGISLIADRGVLLHEMMALTGERLWCAYDQVKKIDGHSVRVPKPAPEPGMRSIEQKWLASA